MSRSCVWVAVKMAVGAGQAVARVWKGERMNKRTFARYLNLCYLSPRIVADILEYKNPANLTLRELMNLADSQMDFERQEKNWM